MKINSRQGYSCGNALSFIFAWTCTTILKPSSFAILTLTFSKYALSLISGELGMVKKIWMSSGSLTLIGKSWKTHPYIFLKFSFSGSSNRPFYTHPFFQNPFKIISIQFFLILERHTDRLTGKFIHSNFGLK